MLHLHRSERADMLVGVLGDLLAEPLADPMAREVVAVPTRGVERWLSQRLSHRLGAGTDVADGVCANIAWPFPGALVEMATAAAAGVPVGPDWLDDASVDPWSPKRLVWPLLQVVDESLDEEFLRPLAEHLRASCTAPAGQAPRRFATLRHLADLYDHYAVHRPDMLLGWLDGDAGLFATRSGPEADDAIWQAELWRRLRGRVGVPSLAERLAAAPAALAAQPEILPLPKRLSVFGLTRLPASHLRVLDAIAAHRDVHLFLLHPSGQLWEKVEGWLGSRQSRAEEPMARRDDPTIALPQNPLLRSWGRDSREMQVVLASQGQGGGEHVPVPEAARPPTLLQLIQRDIRADREPPGPPPRGADDRRPLISSADDSVQVHSCHGRARQVEVVREAVLHLLARDPTLEPRDVIVMCPDIELFAPLVTAAFGTASPERGPELRAKLADRSLRQTNPLLAVAGHLLDLAGGRATAPQLLDFASREPVSRRFGLGEEDLSRIEEWVVRTGTRWGFDDPHRENWHLGRLGGLATWQRGLDRLLLGIAMGGATEPFGGVLPLDYVASTDIALAGRFAELVARLQATMEQLSAPRPAAAWAAALLEGTEKLACAGRGDEWQHDQLRHVLTQVAQLATPASDPPSGSDPPAGYATTAPKPGGGPTERPAHGPAGPLLDLSEARALLADSLRGQPTRANFRTGDLTICTLVPMRSVPHRVVCLLGLDDGLFPRPARQDGDNLLLVEPQVGERDEPSEDRQLLLDALLAAKDHLVITYEGRDQRLNRKLPPAVPVAELLDVIDRTVRHPDPAVPAREMVMVEHPLQAFDPRNYLSGGLGVAGPWRFDGLNLEGARSLAGERHPKAPFLESRLAPISQKMLSLRSLVQFLEFPVRAFLRERVGYYTRRQTERLSDSIPLDLDALEGWALGDRLLSALFAGASTEEALAAERGRGLLPLGQLGEDALRSTLQDAASLFVAAQSMEAFSEPAVPVEINVELPDGRRLVGTVPDVRKGTIARCTFSKLRPKQRLQAWAHLLALSAAHPELAPSSVTVGRSESSKSGATRTCTQWLAPLGGDAPSLQPAALEKLSVLVDLYDRGMREPLPLYCATSAAWAAAARVKGGPREAEAAWGTKSNRGWGEAFEPEHVLVLGEALAFEKVLKDIPRHDEAGPGWPMQEKSRFGRLAVRLWGPVLEHEKLEVG